MARTKASVGAKVAIGKSSKARCNAAPPAPSGSGGSNERFSRSGGNPACPRETPKWQKPITNFFICKDTGNDNSTDNEDLVDISKDTNDKPTSSKAKPKRKIIESDDEDAIELTEGKTEAIIEKPKNTELDETIDLEPLTGEECRKIDEYYNKNNKGKGEGKKTKDKENVDSNINKKRNSMKRDLEDIIIEDDTENARKKVKLG